MRSTFMRLFGGALITLSVTPWLGATAGAAEDPPPSGDLRATSHSGNAVTCADANLAGNIITAQSTDDGTYIDVTGIQSGKTATGVVVKGGNAYNVYLPGSLGALPWLQLHAPQNPNEAPAGISHWYVCGIDTPPTQPSGSFTTECAANGALADIGTLSEGSFTGGSFKLVSGTFTATVTSGQQNVPVPASATIELFYDPAEGADKLLDTEASPAACAQVVTQPSGSFTVECIPAGAQADVGTLSEGTLAGGSFRLVSGSTSTVVTSGLQNVSVPGSSTIQLVYDPAQGADVVLDTKVSPAACPVVTTTTPVTPVVEDTAVEDVKIENEEAGTDDEVAVEGVKTEATDVLAATGPGLSLVGLVGLSLALLLAGAALIVAPRRLAFAKGQHRKS